MQKLKILIMISLAFLVLGGCSAPKDQSSDQTDKKDEAKQELRPVNVKARYLETSKKQQVVIEAISAHFTVYSIVVVNFTVEGLDAQGKKQKETLQAKYAKLNQGEIKEKIVHTKKIVTPEKVTFLDITGIED